MHISAEQGRHEQFLSKATGSLKLKMSHSQQKKGGTGPREVFDILFKTPPERLLSVTLQLSESPEGNVIHVLCLVVLQKERQALSKLHTLGDSCLAKHLAETWMTSRGELEEFGIRFGEFQSLTLESLVLLARVFKVLSEQRLCDPGLRDAAYQRALSTNDHASDDLRYEQLKEEAAAVCGPQVAEWVSSDVRGLESLCLLDSNQDEGSAPPEERSQSDRSLPSPRHTNSSMSSFPTHLEISIAPTNVLTEDRRTPEMPSTVNTSDLHVSEVDVKNASGPSPTSEEPGFGSIEDASTRLVSSSFSASTPTTGPSLSAPSTYVPTKAPAASDLEEGYSTEEEEEATFYAFVIMHAPEDADVADGLREKIEKLIGCKGATFSEDFYIPGKSTMRCVEDSINNTAFTILLLTRNFTTRMLEMKTDSALINSLEKKHKWNTVIPLLPQHNRMPKKDMPLVLQTIVPLEENKNFERKIKKSLSPVNIKRQEKIWMNKQKELLQQSKLMKEREKAQSQEKEKLGPQYGQKLVINPNGLGEHGEDVSALLSRSNIHIQNANYIMIGNDSQMTVGLGRGVDNDHSVHREEDQ